MRGDHFSPDVQELIGLLAKHDVRFLLVGGEAVIYHGYPRLTGDVDFWYEQTPDGAAPREACLARQRLRRASASGAADSTARPAAPESRPAAASAAARPSGRWRTW
jgi:hypothetical protein